jgi:ABC-type methionine transport system permease subunit
VIKSTATTTTIIPIIIAIIIIIIIRVICTETQRMWNLKCTIMPIIIGATGIVTRSLRRNLEAVPGKHSIDSLQKTAVLGTSHIIRKVLQCEA